MLQRISVSLYDIYRKHIAMLFEFSDKDFISLFKLGYFHDNKHHLINELLNRVLGIFMIIAIYDINNIFLFHYLHFLKVSERINTIKRHNLY